MQYLELAPPKCFGHGRPGARPAGAGKRPRGVSGLLGGLLCAPHRKQQSLSRFTIGGCCATKSRIRLCALSHHKRARCRSGRPQRPGVMALKKSDTAAFWGDDSVPATPYSPRDPYSGSPSGRFHPSPQQVRAYTPPSSDEAEIPQGVTEAAFWGCEDYLPATLVTMCLDTDLSGLGMPRFASVASAESASRQSTTSRTKCCRSRQRLTWLATTTFRSG